MRKDVRDLITYAGTIGFENEGLDGRDHYRMRHRSGATYRVPNSPSDHRSLLNARADMRRIAGVKSDSPKAGRGRYVRGSGFNPRRSATEEAASRHIETLKMRLDLITLHVETLLERPQPERDEQLAHDLLGALHDWDEVAAELAALFQPVPTRPVPLAITETGD